MKARDVMKQNDENLTWCRAVDFGSVQLVIWEGKIASAMIDGEELEVDKQGAINRIARLVDEDYDLPRGWTDEELIRQAAAFSGTDLPCRKCPWFHECEAMDEEIDEIEEEEKQ